MLECGNKATIFRCDHIPDGMLTTEHSDWCFIIQSKDDSLILECKEDNVHMDKSQCTSTVTNPTLTKTNTNSESKSISPRMGEVLNYNTEYDRM